MKIYFSGADRTVTGSQHLIEVNGQRLLLECGLFQGHRADTYTRNQQFPFDPRIVDALILSHAHIDHSRQPAQPGQARLLRPDLLHCRPPPSWPT